MSPSDCKTQYTPACTCTRYQPIPEALKRLIIMILVWSKQTDFQIHNTIKIAIYRAGMWNFKQLKTSPNYC